MSDQPTLTSKRQPHLNSRLQGFGTTIFAEMSALAAKTNAINLGQGFPDTDGPTEIIEAAVEALRSGQNQYPPGPGTLELRQAIADHQERFYGMAVDPDHVLVTTGATEALTATMLALCETGDEVLTFDPTYDSYGAAVAMAGARLRTVTLEPSAGGRFAFDYERFEAGISPKTRAVLLNTPHNPTGKVFTDEELGLIADSCRRHDLLLITDEVYEHMVFSGSHRPVAGLEGMADRTVTISSAGKTFSFTGWKIGWAIARPDVLSAIRTAKQFLTFVSGAPFQPAVTTGLRLGDDYYNGLTHQLRDKRDLLGGYLEQSGFNVFTPEGTYFTVVDIDPVAPESDGVAFCLSLPERAGVVAVPAQVFYKDQSEGSSLVRFCFTKRDEILIEAGERLRATFG